MRAVLDKKSGILTLYYPDRVEHYHVPPRTSLAKILAGEVLLVQKR